MKVMDKPFAGQSPAPLITINLISQWTIAEFLTQSDLLHLKFALSQSRWVFTLLYKVHIDPKKHVIFN